ncbi:transposase [Streptomyces sp. NPDC006464]|uniref:transposase n=1 Tax=Streptomyces sp. NPDC006464 TaxID=3154305 RepID=UPI0033B0764D
MTPPRARTWGRRGCTPVVRLRGRGSGRVSMAGMTCYKPGERTRLFYAVREYTGRKDQPKGFGWRDFRDLIVRARIQLGGPIVLVWDNVRLHLTKPLRDFIDANAEWLTVVQLPTYAPDLNPTEGVVPGQARHRQPRRRQPQPNNPRGQTSAQAAPVPAGRDRRLSCRHRLGPGHLTLQAWPDCVARPPVGDDAAHTSARKRATS